MPTFRTILATTLFCLACGAASAGPIHDAAAGGSVETVLSLLASGVSPDELNDAGETPLIVAARADQREVANILVQRGADVRLASPDGTTALHAAALTDDGNLIYVITGAKPDANARNAAGKTPLMLAAQAGKGQAVTALRLDKLADLEITDNDGRTALTLAGLAGNKMIVNILIRFGAVCQTIDPAWAAECLERRKALGKS